jgi:predicted metal-dependent HD superfamily phosphohydrolase
MIIEALEKLSPLTLPQSTWQALEQAYATPPRAYHTLEHVLEVARHWAAQRWAQPNETFLAVLFHDAIYEAGRSDNEERSAQLCARLCGDNPHVSELILLTARHGKLTPHDVDEEAARFLDCDMAILGAEPSVFARYEQQIAAEYAPVVGPDAYAAGRRQFLERLLARPRIFLSDDFHRRFDGRARENLRSALK